MSFRKQLPPVILVAVIVLVQQLAHAAGRDYYLTQLTMSAYYTVVALGLGLLMGFAGQVSFGQGAFFALGGYTTAVLTTRSVAAVGTPWADALAGVGMLQSRTNLYGEPLTTFTPGAAFLCALLLTAAVAWLIGKPALRLRGHYLAMATLGFGLIVYRLVLGSAITNAADGIAAVPPWDLGGLVTLCSRKEYRVTNYYFAWTVVLTAVLLLRNLVDSRLGRALRAIHDHETAANATGVDTAACKLQAFMISALLAAAAGSLLTHYTGGIGPSEAGAMKSVRYVALVALGGMGNLWGVLTGSAVLTFLSLRGSFGTYDAAVFGVILIAVMVWAPEGLLAVGRRRRARRAGATPATNRPGGTS